MMLRKKISFKIVSVLLALSFVLSTPLAPIMVYAQEVDTTGQVAEESAPVENIAPQTVEETGDAGTNGDTGTNGGDEAAPEEGDGTEGDASDTPAEIATGDATSNTGVEDGVNTNTVDTPEGGETTIDATNDADVANAASSTAQTGENTAAGGGGGASIATGDALATGSTINVVNTNIIDSNGMLLFLNLLFGGGFDMRSLDLSYFFGGASAQGGCSLLGCGDSDVTINADNEATVTNSLIVRAMTGGNECTAEGDCSITTGNAYAAGNAVNLVNTNIIDSNYLLVSLNSFGDLGNDIVLPGAEFFSNLMAQNAGGNGGSLEVTANNTATVTDTTSADAGTGDNAAGSEEGSSSVNTGNAISSATAFNQVNSNLIGGTQIFMLFRVWGDWSGSIQGLPEGMMWEETPFGIVLKNEDGTPASTGALRSGDLEVNTNNTAEVNNNVEVYALTGDNRASSEEGDASITTGNAYASANSVNMVNTNVIGRNWIFMIFNIFGNFSGNIAFGHPDLWVGASAQTENPTRPGSDIEYHFTVSNRGDSDANNVLLKAKFLKDMLIFTEGTPTDEGMQFALGSLKRGETKEFVYRARAGRVAAGTAVAVPLEATVSAAETDNNAADNTEELNLVITDPGSITHRGVTQGGYEPKITMEKFASASATTSPVSIDYTIVVKNDGGDALNVVLTDTLRGPLGNKIGDQEWKLGTVKSKEEVKITYTVQYGKDIPVGIYRNTATLRGMKNLTIAMDDIVATNMVEILPSGEVLGAAAEKMQCSPYLVDSIRPAAANNPFEVKKLQVFLNKNEGETEITETGAYDSKTVAAVKRFQAKYASEILTPWGITEPTGSVYHTTKKKINELTCDGSGEFNLTNEQINEMNGFKAARVPAKKAALKSGKVGSAPVTPTAIPKPKHVLSPLDPITAPMPKLEAVKPKLSPIQSSGVLKNQLKDLTSWLVPVSFVDALEQ